MSDSTDTYLGKVLMLIPSDLGDDIVGDKVLPKLQNIIQYDMLDREVRQIDGIVNSQGNHGRVVISKDGRYSQVESLAGKIVSDNLESAQIPITDG